jgi:hypothetical protein
VLGRLTLAVGVASAVAVAAPLGVLADPYGANSTPGTLTCPDLGLYAVTTSGSPAARAVQIAGTGQVFIVQSAPDIGYAQAPGTASRWVACTLYEPGPGGVGTLTVLGYLSH